MTDLRATLDVVWRRESAKIVATLTRIVGDVGLAEELAQDALVTALEQWDTAPDNPGAWLTTVAKRRAIDHLRRSRRAEQVHEEAARRSAPEPDDVLRLVFLTCHPVLTTESRVALTLRLVCGLSAAEIARAFLTDEPTVVRRLTAAKRTLAERRVPFELPENVHERLGDALGVVYLVFNEGYSAASGDDLLRPGLCLEALRLGHLLAELAPDEPEVHGLVALLELQQSRSAARTGPDGGPVPLHEQNRGRWDPLRIRRGFTAMLRARALGRGGADYGAAAGPRPGPYVLQAAIAVCHAQARSADETDWAQIASLYDALVHVLPTPIVRLNRAVAIGRSRGPAAGLEAVEPLLTEPRLRDYHLLPAVRADLLQQLGRATEAGREFERAAALAGNAAEAAFLRRRAAAVSSAPVSAGLGSAAERFLAGNELTAATRRSYRQTLHRLRLALGDQFPLDEMSAAIVAPVFALARGNAAPATWNRHRAAVRSFGDWASLPDLAAALDRRTPEPERPGRAGLLTAAELEALWARADVPLRERTLWRLIHESGAPITTILALDVVDLDRGERRAQTRTGWVSWRSATADLLPRLLDGRTRGPVFLADRRPVPSRPVAPADLCPDTGRRRLSYERAEYLFKQATGSTLGRLRNAPS